MTARQPCPVLQLNSWNRTHRGVRAAVFLFAIPFFPFPPFSTASHLPPLVLLTPALPSGGEKSRSHDFGKEESSVCLIGYVVIEISPKFLRSLSRFFESRNILLRKEPHLSIYLILESIFSVLARHRSKDRTTMSILFAVTM